MNEANRSEVIVIRPVMAIMIALGVGITAMAELATPGFSQIPSETPQKTMYSEEDGEPVPDTTGIGIRRDFVDTFFRSQLY